MRAALAEQRAHVEARAQLGERRGQVELPVARGADVVDLGAAAPAGRLAEDGVRITTRAAGSASSGISPSSARRPETMHASGSSLQAPRDSRRRRRGVGDDPAVALGAHGAGAGHDRVDGRRAARGTAPGRRGSLSGPERPPSVARPSTVLTMLSIT